ncbi:hypothetical protein [Sphingomicrobium astaxanthinifaciens]|uniref:hypothetical protein n=1 Tax=Sphingomicrobium astaxanthinifaciens TaxID=1227949 RepID=UPI001FCB0F0E|nr:hypothetical protein [Sphingomicrobium astaxanthinifaciens]MCJ7421564.1 hypothetical protein [Sphingomicrobium astaxanthinifaciens]
MLPPLVYTLILLAVCGYAFVAGGREHKVVASVSVIASIVTVVVMGPVERRYGGVEMGVLLVDLAVLAVYVALALRSDRFWPLWVAGLQLTTSFSHAAKAVNLALLPQAYAAAARFWVYPILLILLIATVRHALRLREGEPWRMQSSTG